MYFPFKSDGYELNSDCMDILSLLNKLNVILSLCIHIFLANQFAEKRALQVQQYELKSCSMHILSLLNSGSMNILSLLNSDSMDILSLLNSEGMEILSHLS